MPHPETLVVLRKELEESRARVARAACELVARFGDIATSGLGPSPELRALAQHVEALESIRRKYAVAIEALDP